MLFSAVRIEEGPADIYDVFAVPVHLEPRLFDDVGKLYSLKVFGSCDFKETFFVFLRDYNSHSLLRFADRKLCSVKTVIFLGYFVEFYFKPFREFADCDRYAARAEVVAALDHL